MIICCMTCIVHCLDFYAEVQLHLEDFRINEINVHSLQLMWSIPKNSHKIDHYTVSCMYNKMPYFVRCTDTRISSDADFRCIGKNLQ